MTLLQVRAGGGDPWRIAVICILLNRTSWLQVEPVLPMLFGRWPSPGALSSAGPALEDLLRPLGLGVQRSQTLRRFSDDYWRIRPDLAVGERSALLLRQCHGIGRYAEDAHRLLVLGQRLWPEDHALKEWTTTQSWWNPKLFQTKNLCSCAYCPDIREGIGCCEPCEDEKCVNRIEELVARDAQFTRT